MEIHKVADLIPYRNSLEALWDREDFQPVMALWACLYKEAMDSLLVAHQTGALAEQFETAETVAAAKVYNQMYNLPKLLKEMEDQFAGMELAKQKAAAFQEQGGLQNKRSIYPAKEETGMAAKFLADTIRERTERQRRSTDGV